MTARHEIEIKVWISSKNGSVVDALSLLEKQRIPVLTRSCYAARDGMMLLLLTSDQPALVQDVFETAGYRCDREQVVMVELPAWRPGLAARLYGTLAEKGIGVLSSYVSSVAPDHVFVVCKTTDNGRALQMMQQAA